MKGKCFHDDCKKYIKYGNYCFKHRNKYLLDERGDIIINNFTNKTEDYYKKDLKLFNIKKLNNNLIYQKMSYLRM